MLRTQNVIVVDLTHLHKTKGILMHIRHVDNTYKQSFHHLLQNEQESQQ